jgi:hypothetical protein
MTALALPETNISLIFLPMVPFPITLGVGAMLGLDMLGILRGWRCVRRCFHPQLISEVPSQDVRSLGSPGRGCFWSSLLLLRTLGVCKS